MNSLSIPAPVQGIHHTTVEVDDLSVAEQFYRDVLLLDDAPMPEEIKARGILWFRLPGGQMLHLITRKQKLTESRAHFALKVHNVQEWMNWLAERGVTMEPPGVQLRKVQRLFLRDPSGNLIELIDLSGFDMFCFNMRH